MLVPININLSGKRVLIVGGGRIAYQKAEMFLKYGCEISMIATKFLPRDNYVLSESFIDFKERGFLDGDLDGASLVIIATNDKEINSYIAELCKDKSILFCDSSGSVESDFSIPAIIKRGDLSITVATNGKSPALSKKIRGEIQELYGEEYAELLCLLGKLRELVLKREKDSKIKGKILRDAVALDIEELRAYIDRYEGEIV